jgi:hypothetical protein
MNNWEYPSSPPQQLPTTLFKIENNENVYGLLVLPSFYISFLRMVTAKLSGQTCVTDHTSSSDASLVLSLTSATNLPNGD